jgi:dTDP-4-dehydrorhamnose reductase
MNLDRIIIFGSTGMAGHILYDVLKNTLVETTIFGVSRSMHRGYTDEICDIKNEIQVIDIINRIRPNLIINCIGSLIKNSKDNHAEALYINSYFPIFLSEISEKLDFDLIHLSTDCVFDGNIGNYRESDLPNAKDWYGVTKSLGEKLNFSRSCVLRTSIIGPEIKVKEQREGLFDWFLSQSGCVSGFKNAFWSGITTLELAKVIINFKNDIPKGLFHITNGISINKFDLLNVINDTFLDSRVIINENLDYVSHKGLLKSTQLDFNIGSYKNQMLELRIYILKNKFSYDYNI